MCAYAQHKEGRQSAKMTEWEKDLAVMWGAAVPHVCLVSNHRSGSHTGKHYFSFNESVLIYVIFTNIVGVCMFLEMPSSR